MTSTPRHATRLARSLCLGLAALTGLCQVAIAQAAPQKRPNILIVVADDLGYSDIGRFGGEIATPNLDALAQEGVTMTQFYASPFCSPTRAMLMSGSDNHLAGFGDMGELLVAEQRGKPGYEGHLNNRVVTMAEVLKGAGYRTAMTGKWHLGVPEEFSPAARGFEQSYAMVQGGASHFGDQLGVIAGNPDKTPMAVYRENGQQVNIPKDFYSSDFYTDKLIDYLETGKDTGKPFFAYLAYTAPHWPLQAPDADIAAQAGRYDEGYDVIRARRIDKMKRVGLLPGTFRENPGLLSVAEGGTGKKRWNELTPQEQALQARAMEVYAAMVSNLDRNIGRLVQYLKDTGQYDDTLIFFMSDNGSDSNPAAGANVTPSTDLASMGRPGSAIAYGERWAEVSAAPFRLWKTFTGSEGSVSVPALVKLPGRPKALRPLRSNTEVKDLLPTFLDLAGIRAPAKGVDGTPLIPMTGVSLRHALRANAPLVRVRPPLSVLALEYYGTGYVMRDGWKLSTTLVPGVTYGSYDQLPWRLFRIGSDRGETEDLAASRPDVVQDLLREWDRYVQDNDVLLLARPPAAKRDVNAL